LGLDLRVRAVRRLPLPASLCLIFPNALQLVIYLHRGEGRSGFSSGFILGGIVFGTLGFLFAPQISKAILGEDGKLKLPFAEQEEVSKYIRAPDDT